MHWIDWGDSLESVDWYTRSQVRTEVVLFQNLETPMLEYEMRHTSGWGIDEVHGMAASLEDEPLPTRQQATVYSPCARLTIQKLMSRDDRPESRAPSWRIYLGTQAAGYQTTCEANEDIPYSIRKWRHCLGPRCTSYYLNSQNTGYCRGQLDDVWTLSFWPIHDLEVTGACLKMLYGYCRQPETSAPQ